MKPFAKKVANHLKINPMVKKAMEEAFAVVLEEFRNETLEDSAVLESIGRQVHGVTGGQMREFAQRLRDAASRPLTEEQVLEWADAHHTFTGKWPMRNSERVYDAPGETWINIDASLRKGLRGLRGDCSLALLLEEKRGVRNLGNLPALSKIQILAWADTHHGRTGEWPNADSEPVADAPGETWKNIDLRHFGSAYEAFRAVPRLLNCLLKVVVYEIVWTFQI